MSQSPTISTIIPTYNRESLITSTIESVLKQSYKSHEIIVVDDGSTDNTLEVLKQFQDDIKVIEKNNGGTASTRNVGLKYASGDYIAYLDSDDQWHSDKLSIFVSNIAYCKDPDNVFMFSDFRRYDMGRKEYLPLSQTDIYPLIFKYFHEVDKDLFMCEGIDLLKCLLEPYPLYPSTFFMSRSMHNNFIWNENSMFCEDFELVLRVCNAIPFYYINKTLSTLGMHDSNVTWQTSRKLQGDIDAIENFRQTLESNKLEKRLCQSEIGKRYWLFGHYYRSNHQYIYALSCYIKSLLYFENVKRLFNISLERLRGFFKG